jgi:hypothetical protein
MSNIETNPNIKCPNVLKSNGGLNRDTIRWRTISFFGFEFLSFDIVSDFGFRISKFDTCSKMPRYLYEQHKIRHRNYETEH